MKFFTEEEKLKIKSLREEGMTHADIARLHFPDRNKDAIISVCKRNRFIMEPHKKFSQEEREMVKNLTSQGVQFSKIAEMLGTNRKMIQVRSFAMRNGFNNGFTDSCRKFSCNKEFWNIPNHINSYWAGFVAADGHVHYEGKNSYAFVIQLAIIDESHIKLFAQHCGWNGNLKQSLGTSPLGRKFKNSRILVHQREWATPLEEIFSIFPRKTWNLPLPKISGELFDCYLAGFLDGDGSYVVCKNNNKIILSATSATTEILEAINEMSKRFDSKGLTRTLKKVGNHYQYAVAGDTGVKMAHYLMSLPCPHLERKYNRVRDYLLANPQYNLSLPPYEESLAKITPQS